MGPTDRQARIAQLRAEIESLQQELARLEQGDDQPYDQYVERARAGGQAPLTRAEFQRYTSVHEQLEQEWLRLGRPRAGWPRMAAFLRLRGLLQLPPLDLVQADSAARSARPTPVNLTPSAPPAGGPGSAGAAPPRAPMRAARRAQLMEMHGPILNEIVELTKRAAEELRLSKIGDGIASAERAIYLLERVVHAPPVMANQVARVVDEALRGPGIAESDRTRLVSIRDRATRLSIEEPSQP